MADYKDIIIQHANDVNRLYNALMENVKCRDKSQKDRENWIKSAHAYRNHHSDIDDWMNVIRQNGICDWENARDFTFQYLTIDPVYNNSGYAKQTLIKKLKKCEFTKLEADMLRTLILKRIQRGGQGHLKQVCRLIPRLQNQAFSQNVVILANSKDENVARRGEIALSKLT